MTFSTIKPEKRNSDPLEVSTKGRLRPSWRSLLVTAALVGGLGLTTGCGGDDEPIEINANQQQNQDNDSANDENDADPIDPAHCPETSTVEASEPTVEPIDEWLVGAPSSLTGGDPVRDDLRDGEFELPPAGTEEYGTRWMPAEPDEDGDIDGGPSGDIIYAATTVTVDEPTVAFARADGIFHVFANGREQPGDVYAAGDKRVPVPLEAGENQIVLRYTARRGASFEFFMSDDDLYFNRADSTDPHLRVGTDRTEHVGIPVVNLAGLSLTEVEARVVENDYFEESVVEYPAIGADSVTQIGWQLEPKSEWSQADQQIPVTLQLASCQSGDTYEIDIELETVAADATFNRTFKSPVDHSIQYYGVVPPSNFDETKDYGLAVSMHGASVEASSQARNYSQRDSMYVIAPTNRRPFGFDWEEWGRLNSLASLDHAEDTFNIDETRVWATGHSMGGHGTWHLGVMHPGRFAALAPSAGWSTFYSYSGSSRPGDLFEPARAHSDTYAYMSNLKRRGAYLLHGDEDIEVPLSESQDLYDALTEYTDDVEFHIEPGKDHWWGFDQDQVDARGWDYDTDTRQECLDWKPMFDFLEDRTLDVYELDFEFDTPGQWIGARHSYVALESTHTPYDDAEFVSEHTDDDVVELSTENVRAMDIDAGALADRGIDELIIDGNAHDVSGGGVIEIGPRDGKNTDAPGLLNTTFQRPFCFVYPDDQAEVYRAYTAFLLSNWSLVGNGHGCAMPLELLTDDIVEERNIIYVGVDLEEIPDYEERPFEWDDESFSVGGQYGSDSGAGFVTFPHGDHQSAAFIATEDARQYLFNHQPFSSRAGMPDYYFWGSGGGIAGGYFDADWEFDADLGGG